MENFEQENAAVAAEATPAEEKKIFGMKESLFKLILRIVLFATVCLVTLLAIVGFAGFPAEKGGKIVYKGTTLFAFLSGKDNGLLAMMQDDMKSLQNLMSSSGGQDQIYKMVAIMRTFFSNYIMLVMVVVLMITCLVNLIKTIISFVKKNDKALAVNAGKAVKNQFFAIAAFGLSKYFLGEEDGKKWFLFNEGGALVAAAVIGLIVIVAYGVVNFIVNKDSILEKISAEKLLSSVVSLVMYLVIFIIFANMHLYSLVYDFFGAVSASGSSSSAAGDAVVAAGAGIYTYIMAFIVFMFAVKGIGGPITYLVSGGTPDGVYKKKYSAGFVASMVLTILGLVFALASKDGYYAFEIKGMLVFIIVLCIVATVAKVVLKKKTFFKKKSDTTPDAPVDGGKTDDVFPNESL